MINGKEIDMSVRQSDDQEQRSTTQQVRRLYLGKIYNGFGSLLHFKLRCTPLLEGEGSAGGFGEMNIFLIEVCVCCCEDWHDGCKTLAEL